MQSMAVAARGTDVAAAGGRRRRRLFVPKCRVMQAYAPQHDIISNRMVRAQLEEPKETNAFYNIVIMMFVSFYMQISYKIGL